MTSQAIPHTLPKLGLGIGWRPEIARLIERRRDLGFVELLAEDFDGSHAFPAGIELLRERGVQIVPHGVSLSLGSAHPPDPDRVKALASLARRVDAPLVSEHIAFVRAGGLETGHLLPLPRTREALDVVVANVQATQAALPVPLALENIATLFEWPDAEMDEATFLAEILDQTGALLLLDLANVYANSHNHGRDPRELLDSIPLNRIAYVHMAGGFEEGGVYHDTHRHGVPAPVLELLTDLCRRAPVPGVMLERDGLFPPHELLNGELDAIAAATNRSDVDNSPRDQVPDARWLDQPAGGVRNSLSSRMIP